MRRTTRIRRGLLSWLAHAALPVFVLNEKRVVLFFNRGCEQLTGWEASELIGQVCDYTSAGDPQAVGTAASRLCPPPDVFQGQSRRAPAELLHRDGTVQPRTIHYFVLQESPETARHVIGLIGPPEDSRVAETEFVGSRPHAELAALCSRLHRVYGEQTLIGASSTAHRLREQLRVAAMGTATVHLRGEAGAGREQFARRVHARSGRSLRAFVPLDCARLPPIELKLTLRRLLNAEGQPDDENLRPGAVYLQSAGDLPRDVQEMLVARRAERAAIGWQLMSSEERPLAGLLADERVLPEYADLLSEIVIEIPPLRMRRDDLPLIAQQLLESLNEGAENQIGGFAPDVLDKFSQYAWPGNMAELEAVIREAHAACDATLVAVRHLPFRFRTGMDAQSVGPLLGAEPVDLDALLERVEADHVRWALAAAKSNKSQAAELLGWTRPRLYRRMEALGLSETDGQA